jgi:hypothetical protein
MVIALQLSSSVPWPPDLKSLVSSIAQGQCTPTDLLKAVFKIPNEATPRLIGYSEYIWREYAMVYVTGNVRLDPGSPLMGVSREDTIGCIPDANVIYSDEIDDIFGPIVQELEELVSR